MLFFVNDFFVESLGLEKLLKKQEASGIRGGSSINVPKGLGYIAQIPGPDDVGTQGHAGKPIFNQASFSFVQVNTG